jgi:phytoene dehydrogenase-like protein
VDYDAIVVGAGHNGLICAAYLARAGLDTLLVEARDTVGGCASTVDTLGARVNICNCDHAVFRSTPVMDELGLERFGLRYLDVDPAQWNLSTAGGAAWPVFHDVDRTLDALALTHPGEVAGYRRYARAAVPVARLLLDLANDVPTPGSVGRAVWRGRARGVTALLRWRNRCVGDVLRSFFGSEPLLGPAVAAGPAVWGLAPSTPGTGLGALTYALKHAGRMGRPVGGSGALPLAVQAAFEAAGGTLRCGSRVSAVVCEGDAVRGVRLVDGTEITATRVVVASDPSVALVEWLLDAPPGSRALVERWRSAPRPEGYESKVDAVVSMLPTYRQVDPRVAERLGVDPLVATMVIAPGLDELDRAHAALGAGRVAAQPLFLANVPSVLDPTMIVPGPDGGHVFSLETLYTPYRLAGGWAGSTEPSRWLEVYAGLLAPGFLDGVRRWRVMTPIAYEQEFLLPRGHATSFAGGPLTALLGRQPELTRYETPVRGLFLTGAATFPGAGVWGASGRNAAGVVLRRT